MDESIPNDVGIYTKGKGAISTHSGVMFDVFDPKPELVVREDIIHALSNICRFGGHVKKFYSVAQHSVYVAWEVEKLGGSKDCILAALWHDAGEAYVGDMCRPIKRHMPEYCALETKIKSTIFQALNLPTEVDWNLIKHVDNLVCHTEAKVLMRDYATWAWGNLGFANIPLARLSDAMRPELANLFFDDHDKDLRP